MKKTQSSAMVLVVVVMLVRTATAATLKRDSGLSSDMCPAQLAYEDFGRTEIRSPRVNDALPKNTFCKWSFRLSFGSGMRFTVREIGLKNAGEWKCYVTLKLEPRDQARGSRKLCAASAAQLPRGSVYDFHTATDEQNYVTLNLKTDTHTAKHQGFVIDVEPICDGNLTATRVGANMTSPMWGQRPYPTPLACTHVIAATSSPSARVRLRVAEMDLYASVVARVCTEDYVTVTSLNADGTDGHSVSLCRASDVGKVIVSSGTRVRVDFVATATENRHFLGFRLVYDEVTEEDLTTTPAPTTTTTEVTTTQEPTVVMESTTDEHNNLTVAAEGGVQAIIGSVGSKKEVDDGSSSTTGTVVGVVVVLVCIVALAGGFLLMRWRRSKRERDNGLFDLPPVSYQPHGGEGVVVNVENLVSAQHDSEPRVENPYVEIPAEGVYHDIDDDDIATTKQRLAKAYVDVPPLPPAKNNRPSPLGGGVSTEDPMTSSRDDANEPGCSNLYSTDPVEQLKNGLMKGYSMQPTCDEDDDDDDDVTRDEHLYQVASDVTSSLTSAHQNPKPRNNTASTQPESRDHQLPGHDQPSTSRDLVIGDGGAPRHSSGVQPSRTPSTSSSDGTNEPLLQQEAPERTYCEMRRSRDDLLRDEDGGGDSRNSRKCSADDGDSGVYMKMGRAPTSG